VVLGSILGADTTFFGAVGKFYWIAGYFISTGTVLLSIASGERCEIVAEKRSKQRTTVYTRPLAHAKDA
jgi:hypothetical protein